METDNGVHADALVNATDSEPNPGRRKRQKKTEDPPAGGLDRGGQQRVESSLSRGHKQSSGRTLKLNANGKLLPSPVLNKVRDLPQMGETGSTADADRKQGARKPVVLKYGTDNNTRDMVGALIDSIASGRQRHAAQEQPAKSKDEKEGPGPATSTDEKKDPVKPIDEKKGPAKAVHPFFLKKAPAPSQPLHDSTASTTQSNGQRSEGTDEKTSFTPTGRSVNAISSLKWRSPKFSDPVEAVWPPKELVHVRGADDGSFPSPGNASYSLSSGSLKKGKVAAIGITDEEDVTMKCLHDAQRESGGCSASMILRIPGRWLASGPVLQEALVCELSQSSASFSNNSHPAINKLVSSAGHSMTAFDHGESESSLWSQKYAPKSAEEVLQVGHEALMLRDWLKVLMVSAVETGEVRKDGDDPKKSDPKKSKKQPKKQRKKADNLDDFIVSSSDEDGFEEFEVDEASGSEDELAGDVTISSRRMFTRPSDMTSYTRVYTEKGSISNVILLSGPVGCGKTASVYAVARELGFQVFEINAGNRRSAKDILERVGDMTQNHLVHNVKDKGDDDGDVTLDEAKQNKMMSFFKSVPKASSNKGRGKSKEDEGLPNTDLKRTRSQKQSLILLEEADVLFEEDKQFWSGVMTLIEQSKRPIVITCNDESLVPSQDISFHGTLRYRQPSADLAVDYLLLIAANEGHMLKREAIRSLYSAYGADMRRTLMDLNFWCQMGVGSTKAGLDWIVTRCPFGSDRDEFGYALRTISLNTYERYMGWFSRDFILPSSPLNRHVELDWEALNWWQLGLQDSQADSDAEFVPTNTASLDTLGRESEYADAQSVLDILSSRCSLDFKKVCGF